jgi:hypothetical protein
MVFVAIMCPNITAKMRFIIKCRTLDVALRTMKFRSIHHEYLVRTPKSLFLSYLIGSVLFR